MTDTEPTRWGRCYVVVQCSRVADTPLCYFPQRSVFSTDERIEQVAATLASIRRRDPDPQSKILLVEVSELSPEQERRLQEATQASRATYFNWSTLPALAQQRDSPFKGPTELRVLEKILEEQWVAPTDYLWKLSGRYVLTEDFQPDRWAITSDPPRFIVRPLGSSVSTVLYGVPPTLHALFRQRLSATLTLTAQAHVSIENELFRGLEDQYQIQTPLGVEGRVAIDGSPYRI